VCPCVSVCVCVCVIQAAVSAVYHDVMVLLWCVLLLIIVGAAGSGVTPSTSSPPGNVCARQEGACLVCVVDIHGDRYVFSENALKLSERSCADSAWCDGSCHQLNCQVGGISGTGACGCVLDGCVGGGT
jgi:hypothetical protein